MIRAAGKISLGLAKSWLIFWTLIAFISPVFFKIKALEMRISEALEGPSWAHWCGTDSLGRDLFSRILVGSTVSLGVSASAVALALFLGSWLGALAAYYGGWRERAVLAAVDLFLCFPAFFFVLAVIALLGPGAWNLIWVLALTSWMGAARLVRAEVLTLLGLSIPGLLGGSVVLESVFSLPGMGRLFYTAVFTRDYPVILGILVLGAVLTLLGNALADLAYAAADPRIRRAGRTP